VVATLVAAVISAAVAGTFDEVTGCAYPC
jgi:hypothetical protein